MAEVKICGITTKEEALFLNTVKPEYMGVVLYFPKSKRNLDIDVAEDIISNIDESINKVAVVVSPTMEQADKVALAGFNYIQIHGNVSMDIIRNSAIPVIRAFNDKNVSELDEYICEENVFGLLFDAAEPGSGKTFDWSSLDWGMLRNCKKKIFLAGGLAPENVKNAINSVDIDVVDVSSGVENDDGARKDFGKIEAFINNARG